MRKVNLTCVECPLGCEITVSLDEDKVVLVEGNSCPRGKIYAENEVVCPVRVLTTTVKTASGVMLAVKTNKPIKKEELFKAMEIINKINPKPPICIGDIIIKDIYDGVDVVACANVK